MKRCPECGTFYEDATIEFCEHDGAALEAMATDDGVDPFIGKVVDNRYQVDSVLGKGGMGAVYKARQTSVDRDIALKVIRGETTDDMRKRFMLEAKLTSSLRSVHTVTIFDFGVAQNMLYLAMEYLEGRELEEKLKDTSQLHWREASRITAAIAESLEEAHDRGIVHRDLKPANVFLAKMGSDPEFVKVLDFGVAKILAEDSGNLTGTGMVVGTPNYMSPEQSRARALDARSDIYSLGNMFYEMLVGSPPFRGEIPVEVMLKHVTEAPAPIVEADLIEAAPPGLRGLVMAMLEKEPENRPQSAKEVREALKKVMAGEAIDAAYPDPSDSDAMPRDTVEERRVALITGEEETMASEALSTAHVAAATGQREAATEEVTELPGKSSSKLPMIAAIAAVVIGGVGFTMFGGGGDAPKQATSKNANSAETAKVGTTEAKAEKAAEKAAPSAKSEEQKAAAAGVSPSPEVTPKPPAPKPAVQPKPEPVIAKKLTIATRPAGATVVLPNGLQGTSPLTIDASAQAMAVVVKKDGFEDLKHTIAAGTDGEVALTLKALPKPVAKPTVTAPKSKAKKRRAKKAKAKAKAAAPKPKPAKKAKPKSSRPGLF